MYDDEKELRLCIGVDPGSEGAIALLDYDSEDVLEVKRLPYYKLKTASGNRSHLSCSELAHLVNDWQSMGTIVGLTCEHLNAVGGFSCFTNWLWGECAGAVETMAACYKIPYMTVRATEWQQFQFPQKGKHDKERSRMVVRQRYPDLCSILEAKNTADLAEAILIGDYMRKRRMFGL